MNLFVIQGIKKQLYDNTELIVFSYVENYLVWLIEM